MLGRMTRVLRGTSVGAHECSYLSERWPLQIGNADTSRIPRSRSAASRRLRGAAGGSCGERRWYAASSVMSARLRWMTPAGGKATGGLAPHTARGAPRVRGALENRVVLNINTARAHAVADGAAESVRPGRSGGWVRPSASNRAGGMMKRRRQLKARFGCRADGNSGTHRWCSRPEANLVRP